MTPACATALLACTTLAQPAESSSDSCDPGTRTLVTTIGDSIMASASQEVHDELGTTDYATQGCAVGGMRVADCLAQYNSYANTNVDVVAWNCGINDVVQGASAGSLWTATEAALNAIRADGVKVALVNLTPCSGYSGCQPSVVTSQNASLATWCTAQGAANCQLYDANAATRNAGATDALSAACNSGDNLHLSASCESTIYAPGIATTIEAL